jgi:Mrp family chromosome partitioning ATPase
MVQSAAGERVIVVDADLRRPVLRDWFELSQAEGLTDVLAGGLTWREALQSVDSREPTPAHGGKSSRSDGTETLVETGSLDVLVSGPTPPDPSAILASEKTTALLADLAANATYVLIDAPPILPVSDALSLLAAVDGVIVVSRIGSTQRAAARRLVEMLNRASATNVLGVVANDAPTDDLFGGYGYSYSYMTTTNGGPRA